MKNLGGGYAEEKVENGVMLRSPEAKNPVEIPSKKRPSSETAGGQTYTEVRPNKLPGESSIKGNQGARLKKNKRFQKDQTEERGGKSCE